MTRPLHLMSLRTQFDNLGDLTINAVLAACISARAPLVCLTDGVPQGYLAEFDALASRLGASDIRYASTLAGLYAAVGALCRNGIAMTLSPGDIGSGRGWIRRGALAALSRIAPQRSTTLQVGASMADPAPADARLFARLLERGQPITVRDPVSLAAFARQGIEVPIVPDLAFALPCTSANGGRDGLIAMRKVNSIPFDSLRIAVRALALQMREAGLEPKLYCQVAQDANLHRRLAAELDLRMINLAGGRPGFDDAMGVYANAGAIVSNRLHSLLLAATAGATPYAFVGPGERKIAGVFEQAGLNGQIIRLDEAAQAGERLARRADLHHDRVAPAFERNARLLADFFDEAVGR
ncbi:polysaccharide pyruvyl transferase family protein [Tsuneonella flava]|uniref:Polysaccharide pyruvyl transferase family protein n=1 Tax=Tsuneonella flava TaxID=2055955 RepID=A0ABX7K9T7_9SPHN|nr:polysaccharide pyruvyl transferase family protein [Tsuneonella flava]QSB44732.1 polysaccharide pyruvyl transferase family protein [Tsuneonella flava]